MAPEKKRIIVIGSANTDMVVKTDSLPKPGETRLGGRFFMSAGGKGANQAVAAARLGGHVAFVGKVGDDVFGRQTLEGLRRENIDTNFLLIDPVEPSGTALIMVDENGENCIAVASGANARLSATDLQALPLDGAYDILLLQLEIPIETVTWIINRSSTGQRSILNPAPSLPLEASLLEKIFLITPNESEAEALTGITVTDISAAEMAADRLLNQGVHNVIITLGAGGAFFKNRERGFTIEAPSVNAIDTTGAGDTFNGAIAVALQEGKDWPEAISFAVAAASLSVTRLGAQSAIPYRHELNDHPS